jgi:hypothetical protein
MFYLSIVDIYHAYRLIEAGQLFISGQKIWEELTRWMNQRIFGLSMTNPK